MLIKNELLKINPPKSALDEIGEGTNTYYVYATVKRLEKCGRILAVFVYDAEKSNLILRFFSDKKNFIICEEDEEGQIWKRCKLTEYVGWWPSADYYNKSAKKIERFLESYSRGLNAIDRYISDMYADARYKAKANKQKRIKAQIERCKIPKRLGQYCDKYILTQRYIFISKSQNNKRTAVCSCCGNTYEVSGVKHRQEGECPSCKVKAIYWLNIYNTPMEKLKICIPHKLKEGAAMQYVKGYRIFKSQKPEYVFDDYYYIFENDSKRELRPYKYNYQTEEWKDSWVKAEYEATYLYTPNVYCIGELSENIKQVLKKTLKPIHVYDIISYGRESPEFIEMLIKNNMFALAADFQFHSVAERAKGKKFEQIFAVSGQYRSLYGKLDVTYVEHLYIKRCSEMLNEEYILKLRQIVKNHYFDPVKEARDSGVTFKKFLTYMTKQMDKQKLQSQRVYELWRDYLGMCKQLKIDTRSKSIKFPPDIKKAHDEIQNRINIKQSKADLRTFKRNTKKLYEIFTEYVGKEFEIHLPGERADFLREGEQLGHCVGKFSHYYENHKKGTALIIFVRKTSEPDKPFFTLELDTKTLKVRQLRGKANCSAPPEVTAFVNKYIKHIKNKMKEKEKAA